MRIWGLFLFMEVLAGCGSLPTETLNQIAAAGLQQQQQQQQQQSPAPSPSPTAVVASAAASPLDASANTQAPLVPASTPSPSSSPSASPIVHADFTGLVFAQDFTSTEGMRVVVESEDTSVPFVKETTVQSRIYTFSGVPALIDLHVVVYSSETEKTQKRIRLEKPFYSGHTRYVNFLGSEGPRMGNHALNFPNQNGQLVGGGGGISYTPAPTSTSVPTAAPTSTPSYSSGGSSGCTYVSGYFRKNGTYVSGYCRCK